MEYKAGFKNPKGGFPFEIRTSLSKATIAAKVGELAEVPPTDSTRPPATTWNLLPDYWFFLHIWLDSMPTLTLRLEHSHPVPLDLSDFKKDGRKK